MPGLSCNALSNQVHRPQLQILPAQGVASNGAVRTLDTCLRRFAGHSAAVVCAGVWLLVPRGGENGRILVHQMAQVDTFKLRGHSVTIVGLTGAGAHVIGVGQWQRVGMGRAIRSCHGAEPAAPTARASLAPSGIFAHVGVNHAAQRVLCHLGLLCLDSKESRPLELPDLDRRNQRRTLLPAPSVYVAERPSGGSKF